MSRVRITRIILMDQTDDKVKKLRKRFAKLKSNALYCAGEIEWNAEVKRIAFSLSKGEEPTPEQWVRAAELAVTKCDRCKNGIYYWGACVNGVMQHSAPCYRCRGKGKQNQADYCRNRVYDNHIKVI